MCLITTEITIHTLSLSGHLHTYWRMDMPELTLEETIKRLEKVFKGFEQSRHRRKEVALQMKQVQEIFGKEKSND